MDGVLRFGSSIRGTRGYWSSERARAYAWTLFLEYHYDQMPTVFYTISAAEYHWKWLHRLFEGSEAYLKDGHDLSPQKEQKLRSENVLNNPAKIAWAFVHMMKRWHIDVLYKSAGWVDHFLRFEFTQQRGMTHGHSLGVLRNAPTICDIEDALHEVGETSNITGPCASKIVDWYKTNLRLSAWHPCADRTTWPPAPHGWHKEGETKEAPAINSLRVMFHEVPQDVVSLWGHLCRLCNRCMIHSCNLYCKKCEEALCRMGYGPDSIVRRACMCVIHENQWKMRSYADALKGVDPPSCVSNCEICELQGCNPEDNQETSDVNDQHSTELGEDPPEEKIAEFNDLLAACGWRIERDMRDKWILQPPRNHARLVPFISWFLMGIGANVDIQV
jgi:hypothetical protein